MISIRRRLTRNVLALSLLLLVGGLGAMYVAAHLALVRQFDQALRAKALAISTLTVAEGGEVRLAFNDEFLRGFDDDSPRDFFTLWRTDGGQIARSESLRRRELERPAMPRQGTRYWNLKLPNGRPGRAVGFAFEPEASDGSDGDVELMLVVASDRRELNETLYQLGAVAGGGSFVLLAATLLIVPQVLRRGLRPLDRLGDAAARIDSHTLATRFAAAELPRELQPIAGRLNDLLDRLQESFERERRFSANLAHELRTPLAELRTVAECALKWPESRDPAVDRDALAIARQMETLVSRMLALSRGDSGQLAGQPQPVALAELVAGAWRPFVARAEARGLKATISVDPGTVMADPTLLLSILRNLFDNAVEYAPANSFIEVTGTTGPGPASLTVANSSVDLEPADEPHLFERFWRKDAARSGGQHFGLGLSLAESCATAMGWKLTARIEGDRMVRITLVAGEAAPARGPRPRLG